LDVDAVSGEMNASDPTERRFRGDRSHAREQQVLTLLAGGLAQCIVTSARWRRRSRTRSSRHYLIVI